MTDEHLIERSAQVLEEQTEARIAAITSSVPRGRIGSAECQECGEPIPDARRLGGIAGALSVCGTTRRGRDGLGGHDMMLAGLINTRRHHGPDMPLDAKVLARLPLKVLRRVLPELPPERIAIDELSRRYPPCLGHEWTLHEWITNTVGEFWLVEQQDDPADCDVCRGDGEFFMGSNWYDCQECDEGGNLVVPNEGHPLVVLYAHQDGTILTRHPVTGADADVDMARRFRL